MLDHEAFELGAERLRIPFIRPGTAAFGRHRSVRGSPGDPAAAALGLSSGPVHSLPDQVAGRRVGSRVAGRCIGRRRVAGVGRGALGGLAMGGVVLGGGR